MKKYFIICCLFFMTIINVYANKENTLFIIERSKNANIVKYDAILTDNGKINEKEPIHAYWVLYAYKNGEKEELSAFDKKAYGFKVKYNTEKKYYDFVLKAVKEKPMILNIYNNIPKVVIKINDIDCFLEKVYIESKDGTFGIPKVSYYELFGKEISTGNVQQQKILVK